MLSFTYFSRNPKFEMIKLKKLIQSLDEQVYQTLSEHLKTSKADKFATMLTYYREQNIVDEETLLI
jgi:glutamate synthase domain-containing protein 3